MFSFTLFVGKIEIKGDFKGSHKKTELSTVLQGNESRNCYLKKKSTLRGAKGTGVSMPWLSLAFKDGVCTSLKHLI